MDSEEIINKEKQYLESLVNNEQIETKRLEVKSELPGNTRAEKIEFLADISSLANTAGGDLIFGVKQDKDTGKISELVGIKKGNIDNEIQCLENMMRDGIQPRIPVKEIFPVPWLNKKTILIIRVSKSMIGPHRIIFGGHDKFYARNANGKYPMDVSELRTSFNFLQSIVEKIKNFHLDRIANLNANDTPVPFFKGPKMTIHLIPLSSFYSLHEFDLSYYFKNPKYLHPMGGSSWHNQYNLDGVISFYRPSDGIESHTYVQLYRNGIIEAVSLIDGNNQKKFFINDVEKGLAREIANYLNVQKKIGIQPDINVFITLSGIKGFKIPNPPFSSFPGEIHEIDRDVLDLPELLISQYDIDPGKLLRCHFDLLWNSCGFPYSPNYDKDGNWKLGT